MGRTLSRFVLKLPTGVGLSSPWTMQLAIQEAGLPRILLAAVVSAVGKVIGKRGWFYQVAGHGGTPSTTWGPYGLSRERVGEAASQGSGQGLRKNPPGLGRGGYPAKSATDWAE